MRILKTLLFTAAMLLPLTATAQDRRYVTQDGSGTIAAAGVSQVAMPHNSGRLFLMCQNPIAATEPLFISFGQNPATVGTATTGNSIELSAGGSLFFGANAVPVSTVNVTAATLGHRFICKQGVAP